MLPAEARRPEDQKLTCPAALGAAPARPEQAASRCQGPDTPAERQPTESRARAEAEPATEMASEEVLLRAVRKLQGRLATRTRPDKLQKYLQQLSALPLTPHILQETGVRKMVKTLRHHELLGGLARDLAARWKKLALLDADPGRGAHDSQLAKEITDSGSRENSRAPSSASRRRTGHGPEKHRDLEDSRRPHERSPSRERREDGSKKRPRLAAWPAPWRSWDGCPAQASGGPTGPHPTSGDHSASPEDTEPSARGRVPVEGRDGHFQATTGLPPARALHGPRGKHDLLPKARETDDQLEDPDGKTESIFSLGQERRWSSWSPKTSVGPGSREGPTEGGEGGREEPKCGSFQSILSPSDRRSPRRERTVHPRQQSGWLGGWVVGCGEGRGRGGIPSPANPVPSSTQKVSPPKPGSAAEEQAERLRAAGC